MLLLESPEELELSVLSGFGENVFSINGKTAVLSCISADQFEINVLFMAVALSTAGAPLKAEVTRCYIAKRFGGSRMC